MELLEEYLQYAQGEDEWDSQIARYITPSAEYKQAKTWADEMQESINALAAVMRRRDEKSNALINKFWDIETRAKEKNRKLIQERRRERRRRARYRRLERINGDVDIKKMGTVGNSRKV